MAQSGGEPETQGIPYGSGWNWEGPKHSKAGLRRGGREIEDRKNLFTEGNEGGVQKKKEEGVQKYGPSLQTQVGSLGG